MEIKEIKKYMKEQKITYEILAEKSGLSISTIKKIFSGISQYPRIDTLRKIEQALGLNSSPWTSEEEALGVGEHPTFLSEEEKDWLDLRNEIVTATSEEYLGTIKKMLRTLIKEKKYDRAQEL